MDVFIIGITECIGGLLAQKLCSRGDTSTGSFAEMTSRLSWQREA